MVMILFMGLLDMFGAASLLPFLAVISEPNIVETNVILNRAFLFFNDLGISSYDQFLFLLGIFVFVMLLFSLAFKALTLYTQVRFSLMCEYSLGKRLIQGYLHQPYSWFLNRNSAEIGTSILSEVGSVVGGGITPTINIISHSTISTFLLIGLIIVDPKLAIIIGLTLCFVYFLIFKINQQQLTQSGKKRHKANHDRFSAISEVFGAAKEVKVGGFENIYIDRFSKAARSFSSNQATVQVISQLPRYALEAIAFGGMVLVLLYLMNDRDDISSILPVIGFYAFAGYRLFPALQAIFAAISKLHHAKHTIETLYFDFISLKTPNDHNSSQTISIRQNIRLNNLSYTYPNATKPAVKSISIDIPARSIIAFIGATGSGKTTTVDLILGLLEAQKGKLEVDGQIINNFNLSSWQRVIGYVPQNIYLADDSILANIAFGSETKCIDYLSVERAAKIANLHDFIIEELPKQYHTRIGERGVRLSGGQRQRIGIARAIYRNPQLLILDEATSALDNGTEQKVMDAIKNLGKEMTIILIAHRLSTVVDCDNIYLFDKGEIIGQGKYNKLIEESGKFRTMIVEK